MFLQVGRMKPNVHSCSTRACKTLCLVCNTVSLQIWRTYEVTNQDTKKIQGSSDYWRRNFIKSFLTYFDIYFSDTHYSLFSAPTQISEKLRYTPLTSNLINSHFKVVIWKFSSSSLYLTAIARNDIDFFQVSGFSVSLFSLPLAAIFSEFLSDVKRRIPSFLGCLSGIDMTDWLTAIKPTCLPFAQTGCAVQEFVNLIEIVYWPFASNVERGEAALLIEMIWKEAVVAYFEALS